MPASQCLIILGMHRSGTSALTGALSLLGPHLGNSLIPADPEVNSKGYWEHSGIVSIHNRLLDTFDSSWQDERNLPEDWWHHSDMTRFRIEITKILRNDFSDSSMWAIKDPRLCRLLPLWWSVFEEIECQPCIVIILRDPLEVAHSLAKRDGFSEERSCLLWLQYVLDAERWSRNYPRVLISYEQLLSDWRTTVQRISKELKLPLNFNDPVSAERVDLFLEPTLRHYTNTISTSDGQMFMLAKKTYQTCLAIEDLNALGSILEPISSQVKMTTEIFAPWTREILSLWRAREELRNAQDKLENQSIMISNLKNEILRIKGTISWQVTKPLRLLHTCYCFFLRKLSF